MYIKNACKSRYDFSYVSRLIYSKKNIFDHSLKISLKTSYDAIL